MIDKLIETLEKCDSVVLAAKELGMSRNNIYVLLRKHGKKVVYETNLKVVDRDE